MSDLIERSVHLINGYVSQWTKKYLYQTSYQEETTAGHTFMTEFSLPTQEKPIPSATVKVYFYIPDLTDPQEKSMSFRFENDSLIHLVSRTIRLTQMEKWVETILQRKDRTCRIMFLGTQFEQTRIKNERMDEVLHEKKPEPEKENPHIHESLLEHPLELTSQFNPPEEEKQREIKMLTELLYQLFRQIDQDDMGVISHEECTQLFQMMGLFLGKHQLEDTLQKLDTSKTGIISYKELSTLGIEIIHAIYCQNLALKELKDKEEESRFEAQWMLSGDIRELYKKVVAECKKIDEEETKLVDPEHLKVILEEQTQYLTTEEITIIMDNIGNDPIPYNSFDKILESTLFEGLVKGLLQANKSRLENYLIDLFSKMDKENTGHIKLNELMVSLKASDQIKLSKAQVFALQSFIRKDSKSNVNYKEESRKLAAIIKKFFFSDLVNSKSKLIENTNITHFIPIKQTEEIKAAIQTVGS